MIDRKIFAKCIHALQDTNDFQLGVLDLARKIDPYSDLGIMSYPDCSDALLDMLHSLTNDTEGWIPHYCYDLDFGRKEGAPKTVDELYNLLEGGN